MKTKNAVFEDYISSYRIHGKQKAALTDGFTKIMAHPTFGVMLHRAAHIALAENTFHP